MCLIIAARTKKPSIEILKKAENANGDGAGVVWINEKKKAQWIKGLDANGIAKAIENLTLPFIIHFRLGSRGLKKDLLLTHPFVVSADSPLSLEGEADKLFIHNGTISDYDWKWALMGAGLDIPSDGLMSDSRAIAMILSQHKNHDFLKKIKGNFVFVDATKEKYPFVILGDTFKYEDGIYFSNFEWKYKTNSTPFYPGRDESDYSDMGCGFNTGTDKKKPESLLAVKYERLAQNEATLSKLLTDYITCKECKRVITMDRIRELYKMGHDSGDTMKCVECAKNGSDSYFHKNSAERTKQELLDMNGS